MVRHSWMWVAVVVSILAPVWAQDTEKTPQTEDKPKQSEPSGKVSMNIKLKGSHSSPAGNYPFDLSGSASAEASTLTKGGTDALKAIFGGLSDSKNQDEKVQKVSGEFSVSDGKITGKVKVEWNVQGNGMWASADLEGTMSGNSVSIEGKNAKAGGGWNWGGGVQKLGGKASLSVSSK